MFVDLCLIAGVFVPDLFNLLLGPALSERRALTGTADKNANNQPTMSAAMAARIRLFITSIVLLLNPPQRGGNVQNRPQ